MQQVTPNNDVGTFALTPNYTPGCTEIGLNVFVEIPATPGVSYCIYYEITQNSLTQFFQLNQNNQYTSGFEIVVNQDINGDYNLTYVTDSLGSPSVHTAPGHYYAFYEAPAGSSGNAVIRVGAAVSTANVDSYEPNDSIQDAFELTQRAHLGTYFGTLDHGLDIDYFTFNAENGQVVESLFVSSDNTHTLQILNGSTWIGLNEYSELTPTSAPAVMLFRVIPTVSGVVTPSSTYAWRVGSKITRVTNVGAWSDENLVEISGMFRKFHNELKWEAKALDSTDNIISGARIEFEWGTTNINLTSDIKTTGIDGFARGVIQTPDCTGDVSVDRKEMFTGNMWHIDYDPGLVRWRALNLRDELILVGHTNPIIYTFHSCNEDLVHTSQNMSSTSYCGRSLYFCPEDYRNPTSPRNFTDSSLMWKHRGHGDQMPILQQP